MQTPSKRLSGRFRLATGFILSLALSSELAAAESFVAVPERAELQQELRVLRERIAELESTVARLAANSEVSPAVSTPFSTPAPIAKTAGFSPPPRVIEAPQSPPKVKVYGFMKVDTFYDSRDVFTDAIPFWVNPDTATAAAATNRDAEFGFSAKETRLGLALDGPRLGDGQLNGQIEFDFYGNTALSAHHAYTPRTRQAWVKWSSPGLSFEAGEMWETYLITFPHTVNFTAYNLQGQLGLRKTQVRVDKRWGQSDDAMWSLQFAIAEPLGGISGADLDGDGQDDGANAGLPVFEAKLSRQAGSLKLALAGFYGRERLTLPTRLESEGFDSWAVIAGGEIPLGPAFNLRGVLWRGTNLDSAWGGIGQGINTGLGRTIDGQGGWAQLGWQVSPWLSTYLGYSVDDPANEDLSAGQRSRNQSLLLNGFYQINDSLTVGLEYLRLLTAIQDGPTGHATRLQSMVKYQF